MKRAVLFGLSAMMATALCASTAVRAAEPGISPGISFVTLGTNSGPIPNPKRAEPSNLLRAGAQNILVDAGDGVAWQAAKAGVSLRDVHAILISHLHFDHTGGLFAVISQRFQMIEASPLTIYGPPGTKALVDSLIAAIDGSAQGGNNMRGFMPGKPADNISVVELADGAHVALGDVKVTAVRNSHFSATRGGDDPHALSFAFRFDVPGRSIVYTGDTGPSAAVETLARGADLLVSEIMDPDIAFKAAFAKNPNAPGFVKDMISEHFHKEHVSPEEAGLMASRAGVKQLVLTHNALPDAAIAGARAAIARNYKGPIVFATDLQSF